MVVEQQLDETASEPEAAVQALTETHEQVVVTETGILSQNMIFLTLTKCLNLTRLYVQRCHNIRLKIGPNKAQSCNIMSVKFQRMGGLQTRTLTTFIFPIGL